ncbi:hypothetical protein [Shewanella baltica]|uniref:hypothetical protein n=1 Tax=Shewanella baltica TaxID=62322 RepID=UPI00217E2232|nr:hypothetical protein [Shewanella baltica]MCS6211451.1 hypothetical protein [Shewanella baltica]
MNLGLRIKKIIFIGQDKSSEVNFNKAVQFVHGASNTGKSLLVEAIDYMLGKSSLRQVIPQSASYNEIAMQIDLDGKPFTLFRKWPSTDFEVYSEHIYSKDESKFFNYYRVKNATKKFDTITDFYFQNLPRPTILANLFGEKTSLTIRLLSRVFISDEEKIIGTKSPIVGGDSNENSKNKYVFKYLLTGKDDSEVKVITRGKEFQSEKRGQIDVLEDVVQSLALGLNFPDESIDSLDDRRARLDTSLAELLTTIDDSQEQLSEIVSEKKIVSQLLMTASERLNTIKANLENFGILERLYLTDIDRLSSQEEAAFLLRVGHYSECYFCGKKPESICDDLSDLDMLAKASKAEIVKIKSKYFELSDTTAGLERQKTDLCLGIDSLEKKLTYLDAQAERRAPSLKLEDNNLSEIRKERASVQSDIKLNKQINLFRKRLQEAELNTSPKQYKSEEFYPEIEATASFCEIYSEILAAINFPGEHKVEFDTKNTDVVIDGVPRDLNGKGVRAILHSVFKIALLIHCKRNNLYHPGVIVLDSPLVTYRDPLKSKHGELEGDEEEMAKTNLSEHFLNFLHSIGHMGQFIIIENIDMPEGLRGVIGVETFYGKNVTAGQRKGLL